MVQQHPPAISKTSFNCPHCGAYADQGWQDVGARRTSPGKVPYIFDSEMLARINPNAFETNADYQHAVSVAERTDSKQIFFEEKSSYFHLANNIHLSQCRSCEKVAVWVAKSLVFPLEKFGPPPHPDLPEDIGRDFEEARSILNASPRGAAALLRLCVQKLCKHLGETGENINRDIASLVQKGLNPAIQKALDVVRVVGNNAVHPGEMDIGDNHQTAVNLCEIINFITEQQITMPNKIQTMYDMLPEGSRKAIDIRDLKGNATNDPTSK